MYPNQSLPPSQPGFVGSPNSQQAWTGYQAQQWSQPAMTQQPYYTTQPTPAATNPYPVWFSSVTRQDIANVEYSLKQSLYNSLNGFQQYLGQQNPFHQLLAPQAEMSHEYQHLLVLARKVAMLLMLEKPHGLMEDTRIAAETALRGALVIHLGGPNSAAIQAYEAVLGGNLRQAYDNYMKVDHQLNETINRIQYSIAQQQMAVPQPGYPGVAQMNGGYASTRIAQSALVNTNAYAGYFNQPLAKPPTPFDGVGEIDNGMNDIYKLALQGEVGNLVNPQANQPQYVAPPLQSPKPPVATNGGQDEMLDAFTLLGKFTLDPNTPVAEPQPAPQGAVTVQTDADQNEYAHKRTVLPRMGTHGGPIPPAEGLPSVGHYNFGKAPFDLDEYQQQPTGEQHLQHAPQTGRTFESELENDDFHAHLQYEVDALEQSMLESRQGVVPIDSLDDALHSAKEQGFEVREPRLEIPYSALKSEERQRLCRQFRIRIVPAYLRTKSGLLQIAEGTRREIIIERFEEVNYSEHETEVQQDKAFASWDKQVFETAVATGVMVDAASQDIWSEKFFLDKLSEKIEDNPQTEHDLLLGELIADRQVIDVDDIVIPRSFTKDYQNEVITEFQDRGVEQAGVLLENSIIRYRSFETTRVVVGGDNRLLLDKLLQATTATDVVMAMNEFKGQTTLPVREVARLFEKFTKQVNRYLAMVFSNGWSVSSATGDYAELVEALIDHYDTIYEEETIRSYIGNIYTNAIHYTFHTMDLSNDPDIIQLSVGTLSRIVLVPFYYTQYPIDFLDTAGAILKNDHPELYDFLNAVDTDEPCYETTIVTLDNVALTFCRSLSEDGMFFMVEKN